MVDPVELGGRQFDVVVDGVHILVTEKHGNRIRVGAVDDQLGRECPAKGVRRHLHR